MVLAGRERKGPFVTECFVLDDIKAFRGDRMRERFLLREDKLVLGAENANADLHRVGIASIFLLGHAEVARTVQSESIIETRQSMGIASRESDDVETAPLKDQPGCYRLAIGSPAEDVIAVHRQIGEILDAVQQDVGFQAHDSCGLIDGFIRQKRKRNPCDLRARRISNHPQRGRTRVDGLHAGSQLVRAIGIWAIKAVIAAAFALIKHDVEEGRQRGIGAAVKPDFHGIEIGGVTVNLFLLRRAQRNVGEAPVGAPAFYTGTDAETRIGKSDALVNLILESVGGRARRGIADFPKRLDELFTGLVTCYLQKAVSFVFGDDVSDVPLQPTAKILIEFLLFLAKTDPTVREENGRK